MTRFSQAAPRTMWNVPWRVRDALKALLFSSLIVFGLEVTVAIVIGIGVSLHRLGPPDRQWFLSLFTASPWSEYWYVIQGLLLLLFVSALILRPRAIRWRDLFSHDPPPPQGQETSLTSDRLAEGVRETSRLFLIAILLSLAVAGIVVAMLWVGAGFFAHHDPATAVSAYLQGRQHEAAGLLHPDISWFRVVVMVVLGPPLEEVFFRGCLYAAFRNRLVAWQANLLSSLLFAALHGYVLNFPNVFLIGMLAAYAYERTRSLRIPIFFHMVWNLFGVASVKPWLWVIFAAVAGGGLILWLRRPRHSSTTDRRTGWKIFAVLLPIVLLIGYATDLSVAWQFVFDVPLLAAVALYAWKKPWGPPSFWKLYGVCYPLWILVILWTSSIPEPLRAPWQQLVAGSDPIENMNDVLIELVGYLLFECPALLAVWRLARRRPLPR